MLCTPRYGTHCLCIRFSQNNRSHLSFLVLMILCRPVKRVVSYRKKGAHFENAPVSCHYDFRREQFKFDRALSFVLVSLYVVS